MAQHIYITNSTSNSVLVSLAPGYQKELTAISLMNSFNANLEIAPGECKDVYDQSVWAHADYELDKDIFGFSRLLLKVSYLEGSGEKKWIVVNTENDWSWIATKDGLVRSQYGTLQKEDHCAGYYKWNEFLIKTYLKKGDILLFQCTDDHNDDLWESVIKEVYNTGEVITPLSITATQELILNTFPRGSKRSFHAAIYLGNNEVAESGNPNGLDRNSLGVGDYYVFRSTDENLSHKAVSIAEELLETKNPEYDYISAAQSVSAFLDFIKNIQPFSNAVNTHEKDEENEEELEKIKEAVRENFQRLQEDSGKFFCSQFVTQCYLKAAADLGKKYDEFPLKLDYRKSAPIRLENYLRNHPEHWQFLGELMVSEQEVLTSKAIMCDSPSAVIFNNKLYCFHQEGRDTGKLWYNVFDGTNWVEYLKAPNTGMSASPSAVVFNGQLYCFHQGYNNNGELRYSVFDGTNWLGDQQVLNTGMSASPSAVVFNGQLYCFHQGYNNNGELRYSVFDGTNWHHPAKTGKLYALAESIVQQAS